jgi:osmotically-inducible protein OsmY
MSVAPSQLHDVVSTAIANHPHLPLRRMKVEAGEGRVVLKGTVRSYYHKQMAQEMLRRIDGVQAIENHLEVSGIESADRG